MTIEAAFWDDPDVQRLSAAQQVEMPARYDGNRPIDAFGAYDGHPDAEESLYFEREIR